MINDSVRRVAYRIIDGKGAISMEINTKHKVIIRRCETYDANKISGIITEGMDELGVTPTGNIMLKPNVVLAHPEVFPHAFTRKEFLDGAILATQKRAVNNNKITVGERSGITIPTRFCFKNAGYMDVIKRRRVSPCYFDEVRHIPVKLEKKERLRDWLFIPEPVVRTDFLINLPKFKAHPWCRMTLSLKNLIGIQDDRHRLVDHNLFLDRKIVDLQEVIQPHFIAIDAITAGQKMMLTPTPFQMGAIIMGTNSCAVDTVGCHMVNTDPNDVIHLRLASESGFGPMTLDEIDITGDFPLHEIQEKTRNFQFCMEHIDDYFQPDCNLTCTVGSFPEKHSSDYCWGGCPGALQEAMHIFKSYYPNVLQDIKKIHYVVGKVEGPLDIKEDERVIFAGKCTQWEGTIHGRHVKIDSSYKPPHEVDEKKTRSNDMVKKNLMSILDLFINRKSGYIHLKGCPVSVGDHVHYVSSLGKIGNPNFDRRMFVGVNIAYWQMLFFRMLNKLIH